MESKCSAGKFKGGIFRSGSLLPAELVSFCLEEMKWGEICAVRYSKYI